MYEVTHNIGTSKNCSSVIKIAIGRSWCLHLDPIYQDDCTSIEKNCLVIVKDAPRVNEGALILGPNDPGDIGKHGRSETGPRQLSVELRQTAVKPVTVRLGP